MGKFFDYNPDQAYLLPPSVRDVLSERGGCRFVHASGGVGAKGENGQTRPGGE